MGSKFFAAPLFALVFAREAAGQGHVNEMRACCRGVPLKVGYFEEELPPYQYYDTGTKIRSGGLVDLNEMILETMGYDVEWVSMGVTGDTIGVNSAPSYVVMVATGQIDVTLSAPSYGYGPEAVAGRPETSFLTTVPLIDLDTHALIKKERAQRRIFSVFDPFELHLWLSILGVLVVGAVFLKVLDELDPREVHVNAGPGGPLAFLYHATSVLFDSDEYEWRSAAARLFRIGLLFFALVTTSTYTASLAALLTTQRYELAGPQTYAELRGASACFIYEEITTGWAGNLVASVDTPPPSYNWRERVDYCSRKLDDGKVDAMMLDALSATSVVLDKCNERFALPLQLPGFYIVGLIAPGRFELQRNLSLAIASAKGDKNFHQIFVDSFSADGTCENANNHNFILDVLGIGGMKITLRSMSGVFLIFAAFVVASFVAALLERWGVCPDCFQVRRAAYRAGKSTRGRVDRGLKRWQSSTFFGKASPRMRAGDADDLPEADAALPDDPVERFKARVAAALGEARELAAEQSGEAPDRMPSLEEENSGDLTSHSLAESRTNSGLSESRRSLPEEDARGLAQSRTNSGRSLPGQRTLGERLTGLLSVRSLSEQRTPRHYEDFAPIVPRFP